MMQKTLNPKPGDAVPTVWRPGLAFDVGIVRYWLRGLTSVLLSVHIQLLLRKGGYPEIGRNERLRVEVLASDTK